MAKKATKAARKTCSGFKAADVKRTCKRLSSLGFFTVDKIEVYQALGSDQYLKDTDILLGRMADYLLPTDGWDLKRIILAAPKSSDLVKRAQKMLTKLVRSELEKDKNLSELYILRQKTISGTKLEQAVEERIIAIYQEQMARIRSVKDAFYFWFGLRDVNPPAVIKTEAAETFVRQIQKEVGSADLVECSTMLSWDLRMIEKEIPPSCVAARATVIRRVAELLRPSEKKK